MNNKRKICFEDAKRIVVKVGSGVLTEDNGLNLKALRSISRQICQLADRGLEIILVSSGAMASGIKKIGLSKRPFARYNKKVAQILLTGDDLVNRKRYLNARNTLCTLLSWQVIPIINENDTVVVEEIKFGDNDNLAAMITLLMDADILINLTDIDGLYTGDPRKNQNAELISVVTTIKKDIEKYASNIPGALGTGGMLSKIIAAKKVTAAGIPMLIARGEKHDILIKLFAGKEHGTFFIPKKEKLANRKCWIAFTLKPKG
ncbi:MAG: glutamate 5-kinase, partial [Deltaproteobacteria bacterium]|nr:glutamate 5-kinase [Deltaproteobacteria bacterium]